MKCVANVIAGIVLFGLGSVIGIRAVRKTAADIAKDMQFRNTKNDFEGGDN